MKQTLVIITSVQVIAQDFLTQILTIHHISTMLATSHTSPYSCCSCYSPPPYDNSQAFRCTFRPKHTLNSHKRFKFTPIQLYLDPTGVNQPLSTGHWGYPTRSWRRITPLVRKEAGQAAGVEPSGARSCWGNGSEGKRVMNIPQEGDEACGRCSERFAGRSISP